jgi:hypothetical protein
MVRIGFILIVLGAPFFILGFVGFIAGVLISTQAINFEGELPLSDISGIVVTKNRHIFVALGFYQKVQVYDNEGNFMRNWHVDAEGGGFEIDTIGNNILVTTARGSKAIIYDQYGRFQKESKAAQEMPKKNLRRFTTDNGDLYSVDGWFFRSISQSKPIKRKIVVQNILMHLMKGPLPSWLYAIFGIGGGILLMHSKKF